MLFFFILFLGRVVKVKKLKSWVIRGGLVGEVGFVLLFFIILVCLFVKGGR